MEKSSAEHTAPVEIDPASSPLRRRLVAKLGVEDRREELTEALIQVLTGGTDGSRAVRELRARMEASTAQPTGAVAPHGLEARLGQHRSKRTGYAVARKLRKQLKEQSDSAA